MARPYTRANPFPAKVVTNRSLCGGGSEKDTRHFELDLKGWGLNYDVGDSMTVWPTNDPALVDEIINKIGAKGDETVKGPNGEKPLREVLFRDCRITQTTPKLLPRMYPISSSLKAHPDQVHFTIDVVHYESRGRKRKGVCSTFLAERAEKTPVPVFPN